MSNFVLCMTVVFAIELVAKLYVLGSGVIPERTTASIAIDSLFLICFIGWGVYLLGR